MKQFLVFLIVIILFSCESNTKPVSKRSSVELSKDSMTLRTIKEVLWSKAYREQDTLLLDQILDERFEFIDGEGNRFTKKDELAWIKENAMQHDSFRYEIKRLEIYDNGTAIVAGTGHIRNDSTYHVYESSNVLIKRDTLWKAISSHVSGYRKVDDE